MSERSFAEDVKQLGYGAGDILKGEGILAITKALLQSGVSYVGGYPGAPISHLLDVMADANESLLKPMGIYFELSGSEAAAAALLGASINYPMRGAVTWKSVVGTNVASDALSHVASAGVIGGSLVVIGEDYGEGASILQERTHAAALKSSIPLLDPRNSLQSFARFVEEGFGLSEACNEPVLFSIRIRACHMRGTLLCKDNVRPAISRLSPLAAPSFSLERINLPPFTYAMEGKKFTERLPAARRYIVEHRLNEHLPGSESHLGIIMQGGMWNGVARGLNVLGLADVRGRTPIPMLVLNALHPLVPEELIGFMRGKRHVFVVEEGMPNFIERELKALAHEARLDVEIHGKELLSPPRRVRPGAGHRRPAQVPHPGAAECVVGDGDRGSLRRAHHAPGGGARGTAAADRQAAAVVLHGLSRAAAVQRHEDPENAGARAGRHPRGRRHRLHHVFHPGAVQRRQLGARLRHGAGLGRGGGADLRQARDVGDGRRRVLAQRAHQRRGQRGLQQAGLRAGHRGQQVHVGHRPAPQPLDRHQRAPRADGHDDPPGAARASA